MAFEILGPEDEEFRLVAATPGYLISNYGRLLKLSTKTFRKPHLHHKGRPGEGGYWRWTVEGRRGDGTRYKTSLSCAVAVLEAFGHPRPGRNWQPDYVDGDIANWHLGNLSWTEHTPYEQYAEMARRRNAIHGPPSPGTRWPGRSQPD